MAIITSSTDLGEIRYLVSQDLESSDLPDTTIQADVFLGEAECKILKRKGIQETAFSGLDSDEQFQIKTAIKYQTAIYILPTYSQINSEATTGISVSYTQIEVAQKIRNYQAVINDNITASATVGGITYIGIL